ncbi:hypothetical protein OHB36_19320 [Streptomyces sp. NBC_00320]|uniref:hypothetical protein n=1 Tax=Streptomyces sp. NBC_00320 TaxID=2975711 RepID=UPI00225903D1|nr:hypothetical protein [Streptomyces sp. NBC_00320]MCX5148899.1 hypothetical protein [Streptomyces sp. NBC_00320]
MIVNTVRLTAGLAVGACLWLGGAAVSGHGADALGGPADSVTRVTADSGPPGGTGEGNGHGNGNGNGHGHHGDDHCPVTTAWGNAYCPGKPLN